MKNPTLFSTLWRLVATVVAIGLLTACGTVQPGSTATPQGQQLVPWDYEYYSTYSAFSTSPWFRISDDVSNIPVYVYVTRAKDFGCVIYAFDLEAAAVPFNRRYACPTKWRRAR